MSVEYQAANVRAPYSDNTNPSFVALYDATTSSQAHVLPTNNVDAQGRPFVWTNRMLTVTSLAGNVWFVLSKDPNATVDTAQAPTASGNNTKTVAKKLTVGQSVRVRVPYAREDEKVYFVRRTDSGTSTCEL